MSPRIVMETLDAIGGKALILREETAADITAIATVNQAAFGRPDEALLVDALRTAGVLTLSLVALADDEVVGQIAFSFVTIAVSGQPPHSRMSSAGRATESPCVDQPRELVSCAP